VNLLWTPHNLASLGVLRAQIPGVWGCSSPHWHGGSFRPPTVPRFCVWPTVGAHEPNCHLRDRAAALLWGRGGREIAERIVGPAALYRGTSLTRQRIPLGPYRRPMPRVLGGMLRVLGIPSGVGHFYGRGTLVRLGSWAIVCLVCARSVGKGSSMIAVREIPPSAQSRYLFFPGVHCTQHPSVAAEPINKGRFFRERPLVIPPRPPCMRSLSLSVSRSLSHTITHAHGKDVRQESSESFFISSEG
jgi:hypothetical protein